MSEQPLPEAVREKIQSMAEALVLGRDFTSYNAHDQVVSDYVEWLSDLCRLAFTAGRQLHEWQAIETAPRGGGAARTDDPAWVEPPRILAWSSRHGLMIVYWDWYYAERGSGYKPGQTAWVSEHEALWADDAPTHWLSMPTPPALPGVRVSPSETTE